MANRTTRRWHPPLTWTVCSDPRTGTVTGYRHHMEKRRAMGHDGKRVGNRHKICDNCRYAMAKQAYGYRNKRILNGARSVQRQPGQSKHYKLVGGHLGVTAIGTKRRLMALAAIGWSWEELGEKLGIHGNGIGYIVRMRKWVYHDTADKIKALYNELQMIPAPPRTDRRGNSRKVVITRARRKGWPPPFAWDDETIDDPYVLPLGLDPELLYNWYCTTATDRERIEWTLEYGIPSVPPYRKPEKRKRKHRATQK